MRAERGFTLIELITVMILVSIVSVTLFSRLGSVNTANLQAGRDELIAALFFAQQAAMARSNIQVIVNSNSVSVTENGSPIAVHSKGYPLSFPYGVTASSSMPTPITLSYDKLGRTIATTATSITLSGGNATAVVVVEVSGYAH